MKRIEAIKEIMTKVTDELVITTTGMISREVYWVRDRPENFYMCGSMGCALSIGLGLALNTKRRVIVLDGDGAALMNLSSMVVANYLKLKNLRYIILDNRCYDSTGGQPTCSETVDFSKLAKVEVIPVDAGHAPDTPRVDIQPEKILQRFISTINKKERD